MRSVVPLVALLVAGCAPGPDIDPSEQNQYLVYDWNSDVQHYELHASTIKTLQDPRALYGDVAELRGGGSLTVSTNTPETKEDFANLLSVRRDKRPRAEYYLDGDVVVPFDIDTQLMVTLYHHLERANEYFGALGVDSVGQLETYYFPQFALFGFQLPLLTDNAAYAPTLNAFLIPPTVRLVDDVPLSANRGVIAHEYAHAVFNRLVFDDDRAPEPLWNPDFNKQAAGELRSLDEGLADVFGALSTGDANFIAPSISLEEFGLDRDLTVERVWDRELQDEIDSSDTLAGTNPYLLGSVIASAIWTTRDFLDDGAVALVTLDAMREIGVPGGDFRLPDFLNAWLGQLDDEQRAEACAIFVTRFELVSDRLDCAVSATL